MQERLHNPENIKVHFAGIEQFYEASCFHRVGIKYVLFSAYVDICRILGVYRQGQYFKSNNIWFRNIPKYIELSYKHSIMDSGIFTLAYSREMKDQTNQIDFESYQDIYVDYIQKKKYQGTVVEVDCQVLASPELAWKLRKDLRRKLPDNRIINVFHIEDGREGLDRLLDFTDYIAFAYSEHRIKRPKTYKEDIIRLCEYAKLKRPEIDIHILGCTTDSVIKRLKFCTSCDSISYRQGLLYGHVLGHILSKVSYKDRIDYLSMYKNLALQIIKDNGDSDIIKGRKILYIIKNIAYVSQYLKRYESVVGSQN